MRRRELVLKLGVLRLGDAGRLTYLDTVGWRSSKST